METWRTGWCLFLVLGCSPTGASNDAGADVMSLPDVGAGDAASEATSDDFGGGGIDYATEALNQIHALPARAFTIPPEAPPVLPSSAMLTNLPSIATQGTVPAPLGSPGTCEAQSFGYGLGSYTAARAPDGGTLWNPAMPANQVSAAWLFDWAVANGKATCPKGGKAVLYLDRLVLYGAPSVVDRPYLPDCSYLTDTSVLTNTYGDESHFQIGGYATFNLAPSYIRLIREAINAGQAVAFTGPTYGGYSAPELDAGVYYGDGAVPNTGHGQLIVGYDDTVGTKADPGAFIVQNSFGPQWGNSGRIYFAYGTLLSAGLGAVAWPIDPTASGTPLTQSGFDGGTAPAASIVRAFQWAESKTFLVMIHHFAEPVVLSQIALTEPGGGKTATATVSTGIRDFYTYVYRTDGHSFLPGTYTVRLSVQTTAGVAGTYSGTVTVGAPAPSTPAAASMVMSSVYGPNDALATVM